MNIIYIRLARYACCRSAELQQSQSEQRMTSLLEQRQARMMQDVCSMATCTSALVAEAEASTFIVLTHLAVIISLCALLLHHSVEAASTANRLEKRNDRNSSRPAVLAPLKRFLVVYALVITIVAAIPVVTIDYESRSFDRAKVRYKNNDERALLMVSLFSLVACISLLPMGNTFRCHRPPKQDSQQPSVIPSDCSLEGRRGVLSGGCRVVRFDRTRSADTSVAATSTIEVVSRSCCSYDADHSKGLRSRLERLRRSHQLRQGLCDIKASLRTKAVAESVPVGRCCLDIMSRSYLFCRL